MDTERLPFPLSIHRVKLLLWKGWSWLRVPRQEPPPARFPMHPGYRPAQQMCWHHPPRCFRFEMPRVKSVPGLPYVPAEVSQPVLIPPWRAAGGRQLSPCVTMAELGS